MVRQVQRWEANDGTLHPSKLEAMRHDATGSYKCPKCHGYGHVNGEPITERQVDEIATGYGGQFAQPVYRDVIVGYEQIPCDVCDGKGWTEEEKQPVTETKVVGWK